MNNDDHVSYLHKYVLKTFSLTFLIMLIISRYKYYLPFLDMNGKVTVDDDRDRCINMHPAIAPGLSVTALPWQVNNLTCIYINKIETATFFW